MSNKPRDLALTMLTNSETKKGSKSNATKKESRESLEYFLDESKKHDKALVKKMLHQEKEMQEKDHGNSRGTTEKESCT